MIKKIGLSLFWLVSFFILNIIFPIYLLSIITAVYRSIKEKKYLNYFKPTETFSYHVKDGKSTVAYAHYASFSASLVVVVHSLFAYFKYDYGFYPVKESGNFLADLIAATLWVSGSTTLASIVGRNFGEMLKSKGIDYFYKKRLLSYFKLILIISPINILIWYLITLWHPELDANQNLSHFYLRFHHLWFFFYTLLYYIISYLIIKYFNWEFTRKLFYPIKYLFQKFPDLSIFIMSMVFLLNSKFGSVVGNPENISKIEPIVFGYYFGGFIFGSLTAYTKNYIISSRKLFAYMASSLFLFWFLYSAINVKVADRDVKFTFIVITTSLLIVTLHNVYLSMCWAFFSQKNTFINFIKKAVGPIFCFNFPLIVTLHYILKEYNLPIIVKVIIVNYATWSFFVGLSYLFNFCSKKLIKKY